MAAYRSILVVSGPALAHITRPLLITHLLREAGCQIHVATELKALKWASIIEQQGYSFYTLPSIIDTNALEDGSLALPERDVYSAIEADRALLRQLRPDLVLLDWRPSMRLAAKLEDVPVVAIVNAQVTRNYWGPLAAPDRHPLTRLFGQRIADRLMPLLAPLFFRSWARPYRKYAVKHGFSGWTDLRDYLTGDITLYPDLPSLAPTHPGSGHYVGPLVNRFLMSTPIPELRSPVLYITFGSDTAGAYRDAIIKAVGNWPGSVVVTNGGYQDDWPTHWLVQEYVNPFKLSVAGARVAWLFHGGNGTSYQFLQSWEEDHTRCGGAIILPFNVDHQWNAQRLTALGGVDTIQSIYSLGENNHVMNGLLRLQKNVLSPLPLNLREEIKYYKHAPHLAVNFINNLSL